MKISENFYKEINKMFGYTEKKATVVYSFLSPEIYISSFHGFAISSWGTFLIAGGRKYFDLNSAGHFETN